MNDSVTELLAAADRGDDLARDQLYDVLYEELRRCAHRQLRRGYNEALSTTALVNETFIKLAAPQALPPSSRMHFMALAARAMRQVLIDHARRNQADKRGGGALHVTLDEALPDAADEAFEVLALNQALTTLEQIDERAARVVQLHFFGGMAFSAIAENEGLTLRTVMRDWQAARALLSSEMSSQGRHESRS